jgi:hypothetical protein
VDRVEVTQATEPSSEFNIGVIESECLVDPANNVSTLMWGFRIGGDDTITSGTSNGTIGSPNGDFDSGEVQSGETYERIFDVAGTFDYFCTPHPWMAGQVEVAS